MNLPLWIAQIILAALFLMTGFQKVFQYSKFVEKAPSMKALPPPAVKFIGTCEILGGLGIVLPEAMDILPSLTELAAIGLVLLMLGALTFHAKRKEFQAFPMPLALLLLAGFVAFGRSMLLFPLGS